MVLKHVCDDQGDPVLITMADRPSPPYWSTPYLKFKFRCKSIVWFRQTMARQWEGDIITRIFQLHFKRVMRRAYWLQAGCAWLIGCLPPQEVQNLDWGRHSKAVDAHRASLFNIARRFPLRDWLTLWTQMRQADFESQWKVDILKSITDLWKSCICFTFIFWYITRIFIRNHLYLHRSP